MALILSVTLSVATYQLARWYLIDNRDALAFRQATFNALDLEGQLAGGDRGPDDLLAALQATTARALLRIGDDWYSVVVQLGEDAVPTSLLETVDRIGAGKQRTTVDGDPYLVYGFTLPDTSTQYYEFVSAAEYERTLIVLATVLFIAASVTTIGGAAAGWFISRRLLRPLMSVAESARSISEGDLSHRLDVDDDPDLLPVAAAFNDMASAVESRIHRERRFTADVSHELRTPLTALGAAVSLAQRSQTPERVDFAIKVLEEQLEHLTRLTVELLEIARIDSGAVTLRVDEVDVIEVIERVLRQAGADRSILRMANGTARTWRLDGTRLERVVANLVENANRYAGGVTEIVVNHRGECLEIIVDDAGPGVPESERTSIFGRFNRGSMPQPVDRPKGTGLGLSLVEEHVRLHGGTVTVVDSPAGGARFVVSLPDQEPS
jgi:two-component system sensor histidine kinase MtrB